MSSQMFNSISSQVPPFIGPQILTTSMKSWLWMAIFTIACFVLFFPPFRNLLFKIHTVVDLTHSLLQLLQKNNCIYEILGEIKEAIIKLLKRLSMKTWIYLFYGIVFLLYTILIAAMSIMWKSKFFLNYSADLILTIFILMVLDFNINGMEKLKSEFLDYDSIWLNAEIVLVPSLILFSTTNHTMDFSTLIASVISVGTIKELGRRLFPDRKKNIW